MTTTKTTTAEKATTKQINFILKLNPEAKVEDLEQLSTLEASKMIKKLLKEQKETGHKLPTMIDDYNYNILMAEKIVSIIESGNVQEWKKTWSYASDVSDLYNGVINGEYSVMLYTQKIIANDIGMIDVSMPAGFYVTFREIKAHENKLKKGSKGYPHYARRFFSKSLTEQQLEVFKQLLEHPELIEDELLRKAFESLKNNPQNKAHIVFKYQDKNGKEATFDEDVYYSDYLKAWAYDRVMYVLEYIYNINDLETVIDVKKLWNIQDVKTKVLTRIQKAENLKENYIKISKIKYEEREQDRAYYRRTDHSVTLPKMAQFDTIEDYYQTMAHEFAHSTGHESLLNRSTLTASCGFHSTNYAKEELVAELSSLYTMNALGMGTDALFQNSIAYLKSWGESLKDGIKHNIINTIAAAQKATNLIVKGILGKRNLLEENNIKEETKGETVENTATPSTAVETMPATIEEPKAMEKVQLTKDTIMACAFQDIANFKNYSIRVGINNWLNKATSKLSLKSLINNFSNAIDWLIKNEPSETHRIEELSMAIMDNAYSLVVKDIHEILNTTKGRKLNKLFTAVSNMIHEKLEQQTIEKVYKLISDECKAKKAELEIKIKKQEEKKKEEEKISLSVKDWNIEQMTGYEPMTSSYRDLSIADKFGTSAIKDTINHLLLGFKASKNGYKYITELVMALNWKIWEHNEINESLAKYYYDQWETLKKWCQDNFTNEQLEYYYRITD